MLIINSGSTTCFKASRSAASSAIDVVLSLLSGGPSGPSIMPDGPEGPSYSNIFYRPRSRISFPSTLTSYVAIGSTAGMHSGRPLRTSNRAPCRGHSIEVPSTGPSVSGCPSCEQTSSTAYMSLPILSTSTALSSNTIDFLPPAGISSSVATFSKSGMLPIDPQFPFDGVAERLAHGFDGDPVVDAVEKTFHDHVHGFIPRQPAAHAVEDLFGIDAAGGRTMSAAHVVGLDFKARNGVGPAIGAE